MTIHSKTQPGIQHRMQHQRGITLVVGLIMLIVLTLLVVSAVRFSSTNLRIAGNMQVQTEAAAAAQQGIEKILSADFTAAPVAANIDIDLNNDGIKDFTAVIPTPVCNNTQPLTGADGNPNVAEDQPLFSSGSSENSGIIDSKGNSAGGTAYILKQKWDVQARVTDTKSGAELTQHQGVAVRVPAGTSC